MHLSSKNMTINDKVILILKI